MDFEDILWLMLLLILLEESKAHLDSMQRSRRWWVRSLYQSRNIDGLFATSFDSLYLQDKEQFKIATRMTTDVFDELFNLVEENLIKNSNRPCISAKCRLFLTLVYLAHGDSTRFLSLSFKMGASTVRKIRKETCSVLWDSLMSTYLSLPNEHEWKRIAEDYDQMWNFPHCKGAIDGKHIKIVCPPNSGAAFYNYKGSYSIVLLGACNANYTFTALDIGAYGSQSEGGVLTYSEFGRRLFNKTLNIPGASCLRNSNIDFPYFFIGDAAFPLRTDLMRPYPGSLLPPDRERFNKRLSRARMTIENAFGILSSRWRVLLSPLNMNPESADIIVKATVLLHNFVKIKDESYCPPKYSHSVDGENISYGLWRQATEPLPRATTPYEQRLQASISIKG